MNSLTAHIDALANQLKAASAAYHAGLPPVMTDAEFDALEQELKRLDPTNPTLATVGAPSVNGWPKVTHPRPMGSLDKAITGLDFDKWFASQNGAFLAETEKLDGGAGLLVYEGGILISGATRGDGVTGNEITRNMRVMQGVPLTIPYGGLALVRGEVIVTKSDFAKYFPGESNTRNTAVGTMMRQSDWRKCRYLTFMAYNLETSTGETHSRSEEFARLKQWGFKCGSINVASSLTFFKREHQEYIDRTRANLDYDIDGLVIEINDTTAFKAAGTTDLNPKGAVAWKFPHENMPTLLEDVIWQVSGTGSVNPVAEFTEVNLLGTRVTRATLHNVAHIIRMAQKNNRTFLSKGDLILVSRRNDVIPAVEGVLIPSAEGQLFQVPTQCPCCANVLVMVGERLMCTSDDCPAQEAGMLRRWVSKIGVLHLGQTHLNAMYEAGLVKTIPDLYTVSPAAVSALVVDGRTLGGSVDRGFVSLHANKTLTLDTIVGSLGIPGIGRKMAKLVYDAGYDTPSKMSKVLLSELAAIEGFGMGRARAFRDGFAEHRNLILGILSVVTLAQPTPKAAPTGNAMTGKSVCFTGVRDAALEAKITAEGGTIASGVSAKLGILVMKDAKSGSSKTQKATALGVELLTLEEMWTAVGGR